MILNLFGIGFLSLYYSRNTSQFIRERNNKVKDNFPVISNSLMFIITNIIAGITVFLQL
jgi:hypothetical protein